MRRAGRRGGVVRFNAADCGGFAGVGLLLAFAVVLTAFMLVCELYRAFTIKQGVEVELTRAVNTSVSLSVSDIHRRDHIAVLDEYLAAELFYAYLRDELGLDSRLAAVGSGGEQLYSLDIAELRITAEPPQITVRGDVVISSGFLGRAAPGSLKLPVRVSSVNRRMD